jgi:glycosyltransferase involved in cell wall biosynthesis
MEEDRREDARDLRGAGMSRPLVSVVMSVYNEEGYLKDTIQSILNQTLPDLEFIIINDGSTDGTQEILVIFSVMDERIRIIPSSENMGIAGALNMGIRQALGKYIAIMDAGDISHSRRFEKQVEFLEKRKDVYILGTQGQWIDVNHRVIGSWRLPLSVSDKDIFRTGGAIHPSIMVRRELFDLIGFYDPELEMSQEFEIYLRALKNGFGMANLNDPLISVMERTDGMTLTHLKMIQRNQLKIKIIYLRHFLNIENALYTARSLIGYLIPSFMLSAIIKMIRRSNI